VKYLQTAGGTQPTRVFENKGICDICGATECPKIYDAAVIAGGRRIWAWTCPECFAERDGRLGIGQGQEYTVKPPV